MTTRSSGVTPWATRASRLLGPAIWSVTALAFVLGFSVRQQPQALQSVLSLSSALFFLLILSRLVLSAVAQPGRRLPLLVLAGGVTLWASGSVVLTLSEIPAVTTFPAPGEWLFLASYIAFAGYLLLDCRLRMTTAASTWLETVMVCGGIGCLTGTVLISPFSARLGAQGLPLLVALLYPLLDVVLCLLVIAQVALRLRSNLGSAGMLATGFLLFALTDLRFVTRLHSGTYSFSSFNDLAWGCGFILIVAGACRPAVSAKVLPRQPGARLLLIVSLAAILVLVIRPSGALQPYLVAVAVLTLFAAGGRMLLAIRAANGAAEAFALSRTDDLTMLPNRRAVRAALDDALAIAQPVSLMLLDLDGFKEVNDTLGHSAGDSVLQISAHRMREAMPAEIMVARLGGDEFALITLSDDEILLLERANQIIDVISAPLNIDGIELFMNASIGVSVRTDNEMTSTDLLRRADVAMYQAKKTRSGALLYDAHNDDFSREKLQLAEELRRAIGDGQLTLWYQPQIDAASRTLSGVEALIRWQHPEHGLLSPAVFLPAARQAGLMLQISEVVSQLAVRDLLAWRRRGLDIRVAINCAPPELLSGMFLPRLFDTVRDAALPEGSLVIEVTEDSFLAEPERARSIIREIRRHGLEISIDDYGTGFSSLSYLRDLPIQELKMDRSFIAGLRSDPRSQMIVASTFQMARALGLRMVAEGVEDAATSADLIAMGVDTLQGYYLARPMPAADIENWSREWRSTAAQLQVMQSDELPD